MLPSQADTSTSVQSTLTLTICRASQMNHWRSFAQCDIAGRANHDIDSFGRKSEVQRSIYVFGRRRRAEPEHSTHSASHRSDDLSDWNSRMTKHCSMFKLFTLHSISIHLEE